MPQTQPGQRVGGRYRLVRVLGVGGFGRVWEAHDETLDVQVAVKVVRLPWTVSDSERRTYLTRAQREARHAARLREHPNVVAVHDVLLEDETPWIVMRLVDGMTLDERLREHGPLPVGGVAAIARALLNALGAAHEAGIVHRDLKPGNVLLSADGEVLLSDFGISVHPDDPRVTEKGALVGTLEYAAPERVRGGPDKPPGDLFSLGVTLYQAAEGESPFRRLGYFETGNAVLSLEPPWPKRAGELAAVIMGLLEKNPARRLTAEAASALLDIPQRGAGGWRDESGESGAFQASQASIAFSHLRHTLKGHRDTVCCLAFSPDGRRLVSGSFDDRIRIWDPRDGTAQGTLAEHASRGGAGWIRCLAFNPDGTLLASGGGDHVVRLWDPRTGEPVRVLTGHTGAVDTVAFSLDGRRLASGAWDRTVRLWDTGSGTHVTLSGGSEGSHGDCVAFSPSALLLATGEWPAESNPGADTSVRLWDPHSGAYLRDLGSGLPARGLAFSPDGALLVAVGRGSTPYVWDMRTKECVVEPPDAPVVGDSGDAGAVGAVGTVGGAGVAGVAGAVGAATLTCVAYSPRGRYYAVGRIDGTVQLWAPRASEPMRSFAVAAGRHRSAVRDLAFGPDGRLLAVAAGRAVQIYG